MSVCILSSCIDPSLAQKLRGRFYSIFHKTCTFGQNKCTKSCFEQLKNQSPIWLVFERKVCRLPYLTNITQPQTHPLYLFKLIRYQGEYCSVHGTISFILCLLPVIKTPATGIKRTRRLGFVQT